MRLPRVGFWSPLLNAAGGTETWHLSLFEQLRGRAGNVGLAVIQESECDESFAERLREYAPVVAGPEAATQIAEQCDILVLWGIAEPWRWLPGKRPKTVYVSHGNGSSLWTTSCAESASPAIDRFVAVSQSAISAIPVDRRAGTTVIYNGVDADRVKPVISREDQRRAWGVPLDRKVLGYIGRFSEEKYPTALAKAIQCLPQEWIGVAVGDGPDWGEVVSDAFVRTLGRVKFPGHTQDIGSALNAMDALLVPSHEEGYGYSIVEGWMAGVPVIATPVGIAVEHPLLVRSVPLNPSGEDIAQAVLAEDASPHAQAFARTACSAEAFGDRWIELIRELAT